jgi:hypothetical protein
MTEERYMTELICEIPAAIKRFEQSDTFERNPHDVILIRQKNQDEEEFDLACGNIQRHYRLNTFADMLEIDNKGRREAGLNTINNGPKTFASEIVKDIHRAYLMSLPDTETPKLAQQYGVNLNEIIR